MAHMVETMAYAGEVPWHGLGVPVSNDLTPIQMMEKAGVDWRVQEVETFIEYNGKRQTTGQKALVRETDGRIMTTVGENWNPVQNEDAFNFFAEYCLSGDMEMHTAGSLKDGQMVWALAKVKSDFELFGGDRVESYLLFSNPHQYGKAIDIRFTPIRVVCNNTLTLSLGSSSSASVKLNHRVEFNPEMVKEMLGVAHDKLETYKEMAEFLGSKRYTKETVTEYFNNVFPIKKRTPGEAKKDMSKNASRSLEILNTQPGARYAEGSFW